VLSYQARLALYYLVRLNYRHVACKLLVVTEVSLYCSYYGESYIKVDLCSDRQLELTLHLDGYYLDWPDPNTFVTFIGNYANASLWTLINE
jgi:hypothetical protein